MAKNFEALIKAVLDTKGIDSQIKNEINNRRVDLSNVHIDTARIIQEIQNALNNQQFNITLNLQNLNRQMNNFNQQMQQNLNQSVGGVMTSLNNNTNGQGHILHRRNDLGIDITTVGALGNALRQMDFRDEDIRRVTQNLNEMDIQIKKITYDLNDNGGISVNIQGLQDLNTAVSLTRNYDRAGEYLSETNRRIIKTVETQLEAEQRLQKQHEKNISTITKYNSSLDSLKSKYGDSNSAKPITDQSHISQLNTAYQQVEARIAALNNADEHTFATLKAEVDASIQRVKDLATQFQNAEYSANQLAAKPINVIKDNENQALREFEANIKAAGIDSSKFSISISDLREQLDKVGDKKSLSEYLNTLSTVKAEFKALKAEQKAQQKVAQESADVTNGKFKELLNTAKQIDSLEIKIRGLDANSNANQITELSSQLENLRKQYSFLRNGLDGKLSASQLNTLKQTAGDAENRLRVLDSKLEDTKSKIIQTFNDKVRSGDLGLEIEKINTQVTALKTKIDALGDGSVQTELHSTLEQIEIDLDSVNKLAEMFGNSGSMNAEQYIGNMRVLEQTINRVKNMTQTATASTKQYATQMEVATLQNKMETWLLKNSKATKQFGSQINALISKLKELASQGNVDKSELNKLANSFKLVDQAAAAAGVKGKTFADSLKGALSSISRYISASTLIYSAIRAIKQGITSVVELDTALVDLRKTTDGTAKQLREFYYTANDTAKALGVTTKDVIQAAADWSRLGYSLKDAEEMAKVSSIFKSISPGMDMEQATDGLVSAMKAFDIEANDALDGIASKINAIGNSQAVSNNDIVEFLTRSSSAMKEANNTLDETIALGTAATEITRDASSVGNALKTISMRIRGYDENTEEFIGGIEVLNGEIASLTRTASVPGGISLFKDKDKTEFKSTTELLRDISNIYDELTDKQQAEICLCV